MTPATVTLPSGEVLKRKHGKPLQFLIFSNIGSVQGGDQAWDTYLGSSATFAGAAEVLEHMNNSVDAPCWAYIVDLADGSKYMMQFDNEDLI